MSAPVPSDSATNPSQPGTTASTNLDASRREPAAAAAGAPQLSGESLTTSPSDREETQKRVLAALRRFPDFPIPGIEFIDILPIFQDPKIFDSLLQVLELEIKETLGSVPEVIVGLDARGFLFGPALALRLNCSFVPVRKKGKMPGPCVTASYEKEYGADYFQMQSDAIKPGQTVLVVDDIIATGGSAAAAGSLINQLGGKLVGYLFMIEIPFLKGREKLGDLPVIKLLDAE
ncbi:phosphoribosyltransferase-like protein [Xylariales sp. PMI_506]|nr:phosphoribosyltransferase-like protein [Xylariales sp. PMI_506]